MGTIIIIMRQQLRYLIKSPVTMLVFIFAPVFLIFLLGQGLQAIFAADPDGPGAMNYFGLTLLTMAVMLGGYISAWLINNEDRFKTITRLEISPISMINVYLGKLASSFLMLVSIVIIIMIICNLVLSIEYGNNIPLLLLLVSALAFFSSSLGSLISVLIKNEKAVDGLLNTFFPLLIFLGGGYFIIPDEGFFKEISVISPVRWVNLAINDLVYKGTGQHNAAALLVCIIPGIVFVLLAVLKISRRRMG